METLTANTSTLRELRERTGMTAGQLAAKISEYLGEDKPRGPMSVIMMERRDGMSFAEVRDALEHIFGQYEIDASEVRAACRK